MADRARDAAAREGRLAELERPDEWQGADVHGRRERVRVAGESRRDAVEDVDSVGDPGGARDLLQEDGVRPRGEQPDDRVQVPLDRRARAGPHVPAAVGNEVGVAAERAITDVPGEELERVACRLTGRVSLDGHLEPAGRVVRERAAAEQRDDEQYERGDQAHVRETLVTAEPSPLPSRGSHAGSVRRGSGR